MPDLAEYLASEATLEVLGGDVVRDAQRFTYRARQSGAVFNLVRPLDDVFTPAEVGALADSFAGLLNGIASLPGVDGIQSVQEVDTLNQVHDHWLIGVTSTSGLGSTLLHWDALPFNFSDAAAQIAQAVASLDALEA